MEFENCQIRGQVSQDSLFWVKNHQMDTHGLGEDGRENKRPPDQTLCALRFGKICLMCRNERTSKSGLSRNRSSTMPENCVVFTSLVLVVRNSRISWKMRIESWKFRCQPQCFAKFNVRGTGKNCRTVEEHKIKYACVVEADESMRKRMEGSHLKNDEEHIAGEGTNSLSHNNLLHKFIPVPQALKSSRCKGRIGGIGPPGWGPNAQKDLIQREFWGPGSIPA